VTCLQLCKSLRVQDWPATNHVSPIQLRRVTFASLVSKCRLLAVLEKRLMMEQEGASTFWERSRSMLTGRGCNARHFLSSVTYFSMELHEKATQTILYIKHYGCRQVGRVMPDIFFLNCYTFYYEVIWNSHYGGDLKKTRQSRKFCHNIF
jgi:hypothetical protein